MSRKRKLPSTPALRKLRSEGIPHEVHTYTYVERGGTRASAAALDRPLHTIAKTLVFEDDDGVPFIVVMRGDAEVSTKALARQVARKRVRPCAVQTAERHTGYRVGGTSPFGTRRSMPVYIERSLLDLPAMIVNGGARGCLVELDPRALVEVLGAEPVEVALLR